MNHTRTNILVAAIAIIGVALVLESIVVRIADRYKSFNIVIELQLPTRPSR